LVAAPEQFSEGNILVFDASGDAADPGYTPDQFAASIISKAAAGLTQMGQWNAATAVATSGATLGATPTTEPIGGYYETTTAGTRYGQSWIVGDRLLVAQTPLGAKVWGKQAALGDVFDAAHVHAASSTGSDAQSGTLLRPKKTFAGALAVVAQPGTIEMAPGTYGVRGAVQTVTKQNLLVVGKGANGSNQCTLQDALTLTAARFRMRDINYGSTLIWSDTTGGHQFQNIGGVDAFAFLGAASARGFAIISDCDLTSTAGSNIVLENLSSGGTATLYITRTSSVRIRIGTGWTVVVTDCKDLLVANNAGTLIHTDDLPVIAFLDNQVQLNAALADTSASANGLYVIGFFGATSVNGNPAMGDLVYRLTFGVMGLHKKYAWAPSTVFGPNGKTYYKTGGYWSEVGSGSGSGSSGTDVLTYARLSRSTQQTLQTLDRVIFTAEDYRAGTGIALNTSSGLITLEAGRVYELAGAIGGTQALSRPQYGWYNETTQQWIGNPAGYYSPGDAAANNAAGGAATAVVPAAVTTVVSLRLIQGVNIPAGVNSDMTRAPGFWATVHAITSGPASNPMTVYGGPVVISATTTAPTKPANPTIDNITVIDDGSGWCDVTMQLVYESSMAGASPGLGVYMFHLPTGAPPMDLTRHRPITLVPNSVSGVAEIMRMIPGSSGVAVRSDGIIRPTNVYAYDGVRFFIAMAGMLGHGWDKVRSDYYQLSAAYTSQAFLASFRYKKA
jgi:hypothetical protein